MLITPTELMERLSKPNLIMIDSRSYKEYSEGHIPGAVNLDLFYYHWSDTSKEGIRAFEKQMKNLLSFVGITKDKTVVFYDEVSGMSAARGVWLLMYFSHPQALMLDGGFKKWKSMGLPIETKTNGFRPTKFEGTTNKEIIVGYEYVGESSSEFKDENLNINDDGTMKSIEDLAKLYKFSKNDEIVTYCQGGYRAANSFLALKRLGFQNVRVYLGSWGELGNKLELPVE